MEQQQTKKALWYTTLDAMHQAGYDSDPDWASQISSLANAAIGLI